ncbi:hypothetical protein AB6A40_006125 [Gnathostoma spinigerum]|uniref:Uncharacterized protein n=1 Tax=Gnathostoma spinigerum TaxID=75299 RepID=A0ABD6EI50_9BILA
MLADSLVLCSPVYNFIALCFGRQLNKSQYPHSSTSSTTNAALNEDSTLSSPALNSVGSGLQCTQFTNAHSDL